MPKTFLIDFFNLGFLRLIARLLMALRGVLIITHLTPDRLGEYTILLIFIFYFSMLDFGISKKLERDLPHYSGKQDWDEHQKVQNYDWSIYFGLSLIASILLFFAIFVVYHRFVWALILALYLFCDKIYRAYESNARISLKYREAGIASVLLGIISLGVICFFLSHLKIRFILIGFILGFLAASFFLSKTIPIKFKWKFETKQIWRSISTALPLALAVYSIDLFHMIALTVLANKWDKTSFGFIVFAFRFFQIILSLFPLLIQEVMKTRIFSGTSSVDRDELRLQILFVPISTYAILTTAFFITVYWWSPYLVGLFVPVYSMSITPLNILLLALLPLGVSKMCGDMLASRAYGKPYFVAFAWLIGAGIQAVVLFSLPLEPKSEVAYLLPTMAYLFAAMLVYLFIVGTCFKKSESPHSGWVRFFYVLWPFGFICLFLYLTANVFYVRPSSHLTENFLPFFFSLICFLISTVCIFFVTKKNSSLKLFYYSKQH